jgi:GPH family glycoside/pentoside/hexuronide:cation symporter
MQEATPSAEIRGSRCNVREDDLEPAASIGTQTAAQAVPRVRRLPKRSVLAYGAGSIAFGVKDNGFQTFLLIFYNQVLGLSAAAVGTTILLALLLDAFIDPMIGSASDRTRTGWGRRHPWMYASAVPIALGWLLLWNPPAWSQGALLAWLFATSVLVRTAISAYEVPSAALAPELSADYDERTRLIAYRYIFGWAGGLSMLLAAYTIFLVPTADQPNGLLNRDGYRNYAVAGSVLILASILISARGTHGEIKWLPRQTNQPAPLSRIFREFIGSVRNRAFLLLLLAGMCAFTSQGINFALANYFYVYIWELSPLAFLSLAGVLFAGALSAFLVGPRVARRIGKRKAATLFMLANPVAFSIPYVLRLLDLFPLPGDPALNPLLFLSLVVSVGCGVSAFIIASSMMADVVEDSEAVTGRRSEGVFVAGSFFVQKCASGIGIFLAGALLSLAAFPANAKPGAVPEAILDRLTILSTLVVLGLSWGAAWLYSRFPFGKADHDARVRRLAGRPEDGAA